VSLAFFVGGLTKRAADGWESARFTGIFPASGLYCSQAVFSPAAANANRWAAAILVASKLISRKIFSMGFVLQASCSKCKYQSENLTIGDGMHSIFICENCNSVVNSQRMPFRFTWSPCPNCKNILRKSARVDSANLVVSYDEPLESKYQCPRCTEKPLGFKTILHFSRSFDERIPTTGMLVHGRFTKSGELEIPFPFQSYYVAHLENTVMPQSEEVMELRVTQLEPEPSNDKNKLPAGMNVFLEFVRYMPQEDLERESLERTDLFSDDNAT